MNHFLKTFQQENTKIPIWLNNGSQRTPMMKPTIEIIIAVFFTSSLVGRKFKSAFCVGI